ncbi:MAG: hypothetical protein ACMUHM_02630 [Thermoplasmatota archaeon]
MTRGRVEMPPKGIKKKMEKKPRKKRREIGGIPALVALIVSMIALVLWAIYIPFTFHKVASLLCLAFVLPVCLILIILGIILSVVSLYIGPGKRRMTAVLALVLSIAQVIIWVGWIIFGLTWNT